MKKIVVFVLALCTVFCTVQTTIADHEKQEYKICSTTGKQMLLYEEIKSLRVLTDAAYNNTYSSTKMVKDSTLPLGYAFVKIFPRMTRKEKIALHENELMLARENCK